MFSLKTFVRGSFIVFLLAGLMAVIVAPMLATVRAAPQMQVVTHIVISQVYGGGGNTGATYQNDYVELFNPSNASLSLNGWSIQYAPATGNGLFSANVTNVSGTLTAGQYYLVKLAGGAIGMALPTPDTTGTTNLSATAGKIVLASTTTGLACNGGSTSCGQSDLNSIVDLVGYGTANFYEGGSSAPAPSSTTSDIRQVNGCIDSNNNSADFVASITSPRNTASTTTNCSGLFTATASAANLTGTALAANLTGTASAVNLTGTAAGLTATASSANLTGTASVVNLTGTAAGLTVTATVTPCPITHHSLLINEVAWMGTKASSSDEWVEFYNPTSCAIDLTGWKLVGTNYYYTTGNFTITFTSGYTIAPGGYFVVAANPAVFQTAFTSNFYATSALQLIDHYQSLQLVSASNIQVDTANYLGLYNWPAGSSTTDVTMERYGQVDDSPGAWVTYAGPTGPTSTNVKDRNGNYVQGTPGGPNWAASVTITPSPVPSATEKPRIPTSVPPTPFGHVVINEILPRAGFDWNNDGVIDINDEFIEIKNNGPVSVSLGGWRLSDDPNIGGKTFTLPSQTLQPGQRVIYYGSTSHILLVDTGDTIRLTNSRSVMVDAHTYGVAKYPDQSWCRIPDGGEIWKDNCFPTPGNENTLAGIIPSLPPPKLDQHLACLLPDITPTEFILAECSAFGGDVWNQGYWNRIAGQNQFVFPDPLSKGEIIIE